MQVSEEIDALRAMGFSPIRWLVLPRCLALVLAVPVLTWIGDVLALVGGLAAYGGAVAVGARTTTAVVVSIFAVIVISSVFTCVFALMGV